MSGTDLHIPFSEIADYATKVLKLEDMLYDTFMRVMEVTDVAVVRQRGDIRRNQAKAPKGKKGPRN